jgi:ABC-2 type transport system permease protein
MSWARVFFSSAIFSFKAQFSWLNPPMWLTMKFVLSISQMAFFVFVGMFIRGTSVIPYIAVGNAVQAVAWNTVFAVINITGSDKWQGTLPLMLATPASRLPIFIGRSMMHVIDGMLSVAISLFFAAFFFGVDFGHADIIALAVSVLLTSLTMAGYGLLIGGFAFYFRDPMIFANIFTYVLLIFCGVNFPISYLPSFVQPISYLFPLTYGVDAARAAIAGSSLLEVAPTLGWQVLVGVGSMLIGYMFFKSFENTARKTGRLEAQ